MQQVYTVSFGLSLILAYGITVIPRISCTPEYLLRFFYLQLRFFFFSSFCRFDYFEF